MKKYVRGKKRAGSATWWSITLALVSLSLVCLLGIALWIGFGGVLSGSAIEEKNRHLAPLNAPKASDLPMFKGDYASSMLWGTYRSHLFLGIRARLPLSLLAGLMWVAPRFDDLHIRHFCQMNDPLLKSYGWLRHDGRSYGRQLIQDGQFDMHTSFLKSLDGPSASVGGDWAVRVAVERGRREREGESEEKETPMFLFFYMAEESGSPLHAIPHPSSLQRFMKPAESDTGSGSGSDTHSAVIASGVSQEHGNWELHVVAQPPLMANYLGLQTTHFHNLSDAVKWDVINSYRSSQSLTLSDSIAPKSNVAVLQLTIRAPAVLDFVFVSRLEASPGSSADTAAVQRVAELSGPALSSRLSAAEAAFDDRFRATFPIDPEVEGQVQGTEEVAKAALSNLIGGMGYFYGQSRIAVPKHLQASTSDPYWLYWPAQLYTAVPSRSAFPRGFLWDEGFHQLIISKWDERLSMEAIASWLDLLNSEGWIPREQILGEEARSVVPEEFIQQHVSNGNPPTLFLSLAAMASHLTPSSSVDCRDPSILSDLPSSFAARTTSAGNRSDGTALTNCHRFVFLQQAFPRLLAWFNWFTTTQAGELPGSFYWHGRDAETNKELNPKTLQSGLDDHPRASHPSPIERHLDLHCWLAVAAHCLAVIGNATGQKVEDAQLLARQLADIDRLKELHFDSATGTFADFGNHTEKVKLERVEYIDPATSTLYRTYQRTASGVPAPGFVPHFGYVSLFPLLLKLLPPDSSDLTRMLEKLGDEMLLWTSYGLRSLSTNSSLYNKRNTEHDPPYWRGTVWININYLALAALKHYGSIDSSNKARAQELYHQLRLNLLRNIVRRYRESGYLWEQYDNKKSGKGKGVHPFTGWTALVVLIASESL